MQISSRLSQKAPPFIVALATMGLTACAATTESDPTKPDFISDTADRVEIGSTAQALGYTTDPCTTVTPDATLSLGTGSIPYRFFDAADANYGHPGCEDMYVVEISNTYGNFNPLYLAANWAPPGLPQDGQTCTYSWVHVKFFGQFSSGSWYLENDENIFATWDGQNCGWPISQYGGTPETFYWFTPAYEYSKLRIAVTAAWAYWKVPAEAYIWPQD